jgi:hypothetical protein
LAKRHFRDQALARHVGPLRRWQHGGVTVEMRNVIFGDRKVLSIEKLISMKPGRILLAAQELCNRTQWRNTFADNLQAGEHRYGNQSTDVSPRPAGYDNREKRGNWTECHSSAAKAWTRLSNVRMPARDYRMTITNSAT